MTIQLSPSRPTMPRGRSFSTFARIYAGAWIVLAGVALSYLLVVAFNPALLAGFSSHQPEIEISDAQRAAARFATDMTGLRQTVGELQQDMRMVRFDLVATATREKGMVERLSVLEQQVKTSLVAEQPAPLPRPPVQRQSETKTSKVAAAATTAVALPTETAAPAADLAVPPRVVMLNAPAPAPVALPGAVMTGSIASAAPAAASSGTSSPAGPVTFGPGSVRPIIAKASSGPSAVELSSAPSLEVLRLNWSLLADRHSTSLKNLEARYLNAGEGSPYQLIAGPIKTPEEAARVCAQLRAKRVTCRVASFGGNVL